MIDPISAFAMASTAFNVIKKGFEIGRDVEDMAGDIGRWMGAVGDLNTAYEQAKNPPLFKRIVFAKSVEEEAMTIWQHKKKTEQMREELRSLISFMRGPAAWDELIRMEASIRKDRQDTIKKQKAAQGKFFEYLFAIIIALVGIAMVSFIAYLVYANSKYYVG